MPVRQRLVAGPAITGTVQRQCALIDNGAVARFASELYVVPQPAISMVAVAIVATSTLALAIMTAIVPGWRAAHTSVASALRAE